MYKKIISILAILFLTSSASVFAQSASPSPTPNGEASSFEMFWPITAGRTMGDPMYLIKSYKEKAREMLLFSNFKKVDYNIVLVEKRVVEAEKLFLISNDGKNGNKTLQAAQEKRRKVNELIAKTEKEGEVVVNLKDRFKSSLEKQKKLLEFIKSKSQNETDKAAVQSDLDMVNSLLQ